MLGYASKEELLGVNLASELFRDPYQTTHLLGQPEQKGQSTPSK